MLIYLFAPKISLKWCIFVDVKWMWIGFLEKNNFHLATLLWPMNYLNIKKSNNEEWGWIHQKELDYRNMTNHILICI